MTRHKADLHIIAQDPQLPGLALLLDPGALLAALRHLPALRDAQSVKIDYLRYKPGNSCATSVIVNLGSQPSKTYFAKALTPERFTQSWQHPKRQALIASGDADAPLALHDSAILLQHPLHDRAIRFLHPLKDDATRHRLFSQLLPSYPNPECLSWRFLRYKPERRCVILLSHQDNPIAVLRCASATEYGHILQGAAVGTALGHVSLLGAVGSLRMLATGWIAGESLGPELHGGKPDLNAIAEAGTALAQLHNTPFSLPLQRNASHNIQALWRTLDTLAVISPSSVMQFRELAERVAQYLLTCQTPPVLIHGDFSADQVVKPADGGTVKIIDWDRCAYGSPLADLASFQARLELQVIQQVIQRESANRAMAAFLGSYSAHRSQVEQQPLAWYSAWALLCLATEPFRARASNWPAQVDALLERVQQLLAHGTPIVSAQPDAMLEQLATPSVMSAPLRQVLNLPPQSQLQGCHILRHKPGKRALIAYQIAEPDCQQPHIILGKYAKKGVNSASFTYQKILWQQGWDETAEFSVPEPLALLPAWNTWLQRKVEAHPLTELLNPAEPRLAILGKQVANALTALHQHQILRQAVSSKHWHISDELAVLQSGLQKVAALYPHWQTRLSHLLAACQKLAISLPGGIATCVHRDFYPDQVLVSHPLRLTLLDFDLCCTSTPALDAGNYIAHVRELALRHHNDMHRLHEHEQAFVSAFLAGSPGVTSRSVEAFTILSLTRHIFLSTQFADRHHTTAALLTLCEHSLTPWMQAGISP